MMKQITVITDERPGIVADLCKVLADDGINIETFNAEVQDEHGVIILTVDQYDAALKALTNADYQAFSEDVIIIKLKDEPGALARISLREQPQTYSNPCCCKRSRAAW